MSPDYEAQKAIETLRRLGVRVTLFKITIWNGEAGRWEDDSFSFQESLEEAKESAKSGIKLYSEGDEQWMGARAYKVEIPITPEAIKDIMNDTHDLVDWSMVEECTRQHGWKAVESPTETPA